MAAVEEAQPATSETSDPMSPDSLADTSKRAKRVHLHKDRAVRLPPGSQINLLWPRDGRWRIGTVLKYDPKKALHTVAVSPVDSRRVDLRNVPWEPIAIATPAAQVAGAGSGPSLSQPPTHPHMPPLPHPSFMRHAAAAAAAAAASGGHARLKFTDSLAVRVSRPRPWHRTVFHPPAGPLAGPRPFPRKQQLQCSLCCSQARGPAAPVCRQQS